MDEKKLKALAADWPKGKTETDLKRSFHMLTKLPSKTVALNAAELTDHLGHEKML